MTYVKVYPEKPKEETPPTQGTFETVIGEVITETGADVLIVPLPLKAAGRTRHRTETPNGQTFSVVSRAYPAWAAWLKTFAHLDKGAVGELGPLWLGTPERGERVTSLLPLLPLLSLLPLREKPVLIVIAWTKETTLAKTSEATVRAVLGALTGLFSECCSHPSWQAHRPIRVALPAIGCNTSGLSWLDVSMWAQKAFSGLPFEVTFTVS